ncbi:hypothetical protein P8C59_004982 [Phyllachora maydis]|uniref:Reverse transcriptase Ty1/copia-type domain-containing protein n=1 Tax=Phyllachora maydis TaxID=1825666 RepID=A0AAD9I4L7_9PEZI|nr:hypothetical protein P8C59_004982 [Phyllachora maydis]
MHLLRRSCRKQSPREWQDKLKILLKSLGYLPLISDPGVFYNAKTCYFIVTYIDNCLFIGPNIGYITDLKKRLNKVYAIEDLGPAAYFLGLSRSLNRPTKSHLNAAKNLFKYLNSTKDYSICFSYNGNTVADLGPKLSNSSNITTKLSRDFHSKEGPRPLTTTSTTIVDSRNSKGSSQTSIINSSLVPRGFSDSDFAEDKATSKSTYGYLYKLAGVFYNAKTCHFIVTYIDDCLFIGPNIGYITDLKKRLNKVYAIEDLGPAAYFLGVQIIRDRPNRRLWLNQVDISFTIQWLSRSLNRPPKSHLNAAKNLFKYLNSTKGYSICFSYNGNTVADLGPKLSNNSNTTTKLSRDFHSKERPRPLTTTSTTIVDSRNSKGSSRTSIINSSLVPIGFSDSDFAEDKAISKSTYCYLYKLAGRPISWKTKRATTIALSTLEAETDGLTEAIREVQ